MRQIKGTKMEMYFTGQLALDYIRDKSNPSHLRWQMFCTIISDGMWREHKTYYYDFDCLDKYNFSPYDDFYMERHTDHTLPDLYEQIYELLSQWVEDGKMTNEEFYELMPVLQEEMMQSGISSFTYDW
jgi:hypothetical protein